MFCDICFDHLVSDRTRAHCQISSRPKMTTPELLPEVRKFLKKHSRTCPLQPLYYLAYILVRKIRNQNVNMVASNLPRNYLDLMFHGNLPDQVAHTYCHRPNQYLLTVFRNPYQVNFNIVGRVRAFTVPSHATILHDSSLRLKARGFHHPRGGN